MPLVKRGIIVLSLPVVVNYFMGMSQKNLLMETLASVNRVGYGRHKI